MIDDPRITQTELTGGESLQVAYYCTGCGQALFEGDRIAEIEDSIICMDCLKDNYTRLI